MKDDSLVLITREHHERYRFSSMQAARSWAARNIWLLNTFEKALDLFWHRPAKIPEAEKADFRPGGRKRFPRLDPDSIVRLFVRYGRLLERRKVGGCGEKTS